MNTGEQSLEPVTSAMETGEATGQPSLPSHSAPNTDEATGHVTRQNSSSSTLATKATESAQANPFHIGTVYTITGWRYWLLVWPGAMLLRLLYATWRIEMSEQDRLALSDTSKPVVGVLWHSRSFVLPMILRKMRIRGKCVTLISPSKAAAWEVAFFKALGLPSVRGSSSRRSIQAVRDMLKVNRQGNDLYISPDGPSGPAKVFKRGAVATARLTKAPVLLIGAESSFAWRPHTWDRHLFPLPFARFRLKGIRLENGVVFDGVRTDEEACNLLTQKLNEINQDQGL